MPQRCISDSISRPKSSGVLNSISTAMRRMVASVAGRFMTLCDSALSVSMIGRGVRAGASIPSTAAELKPGTPASAIVGRSGADGERRALAIPSARSRPLSIWGFTVSALPNTAATSPVMVPINAGPAPLNGTSRSFTPAIWLKSSAVRCAELPVPPEP